jgi:putative acetyltransferase
MNGSMFDIREDDLSGAATRALVALHLQGMRANTPPEAVYALDVSGLIQPGVTVWTAWDRETVVAMGALKLLADRTGEVKSMRTHPDHLRRGAAAQILDHIIGEARRNGLQRLSLETGNGPSFEPALTLYRKRGFTNGEKFSDYIASAFNQFLHLEL